MKYLSLCSGIEAATVAWKPLGWKPVAFSEIDRFPCAVIKHHYPDVRNLGDMTQWQTWDEETLKCTELLIAGTPCQAFSVAGLRSSLNDERGNLTLEMARIYEHIESTRKRHQLAPPVLLWENVPGVLNTKDNAFGCLLGALAREDGPLQPPGKRWTNAGYVLGPERTIAWRVLDAQYFGVAQRRRRVFLVASAGNIDAREVLFEQEGLRRDFAPSRETGEDITQEVAGSLGCRGVRSHTELDGHGAYVPLAFDWQSGGDSRGLDLKQTSYIRRNMQVRRLTPTECERLQGFPDNYSNIPYGRPKHPGEICPDGHRYKALGNSMAVPVMRWLGERLNQ